jgi:hypothetical protein
MECTSVSRQHACQCCREYPDIVRALTSVLLGSMCWLTFCSHRSEERAYPCDFAGCFKSFVSPAQLSLHKCKHTGAARPHKCSRSDLNCTKTFNTPSQLANHEQTHLPQSARQMQNCPYPGCTRGYHSQSAVLKHYATEHDESQLHYRCSDVGLMSIFVQSPQLEQIVSTCKSAFYFKATWKEHLISKHRLNVTHPQLQQVVQYQKTQKLMAKIGLQGMAANINMMLPPPTAAAAASSTPQQLAATAVSNAIRAASSTTPAAVAAGVSAATAALPVNSTSSVAATAAGLPAQFLSSMPGFHALMPSFYAMASSAAAATTTAAAAAATSVPPIPSLPVSTLPSLPVATATIPVAGMRPTTAIAPR